MRESTRERKTNVTDIQVAVNLDGTGVHKISTGVGFFDHMLAQLAVHSGMDLVVRCRGDLNIDAHHTVEDTGLVLGDAIKEALGERRDIARYGTSIVPTDDALVMSSVDLGGRAFFLYNVNLEDSAIGQFDTSLCEEFFRSISERGSFTLHINQFYGKNLHHIIESIFKSFGHALRDARTLIPGSGIMSVKGTF